MSASHLSLEPSVRVTGKLYAESFVLDRGPVVLGAVQTQTVSALENVRFKTQKQSGWVGATIQKTVIKVLIGIRFVKYIQYFCSYGPFLTEVNGEPPMELNGLGSDPM